MLLYILRDQHENIVAKWKQVPHAFSHTPLKHHWQLLTATLPATHYYCCTLTHFHPLHPAIGRSVQRAVHMTGGQLMATWLTRREMYGAGEQLRVNGIWQDAGLGACASFQSNMTSCCSLFAATLSNISRNEKLTTFASFGHLHLQEVCTKMLASGNAWCHKAPSLLSPTSLWKMQKVQQVVGFVWTAIKWRAKYAVCVNVFCVFMFYLCYF